VTILRAVQACYLVPQQDIDHNFPADAATALPAAVTLEHMFLLEHIFPLEPGPEDIHFGHNLDLVDSVWPYASSAETTSAQRPGLCQRLAQ
jgi:hypothetical protein